MHFRSIALVALLAAFMAPAWTQAAPVSLSGNGIVIDAGSMGTFTLAYPELIDVSGGKPYKIFEKDASGSSETIKYEGGASLVVSLAASGVTLRFDNLPNAVKSFQMDMLIDFSLSQGGRYKAGTDDFKPFPAELPANPNFVQTHAASFTIEGVSGQTLSFQLPPYSFEQLTDNRAWNWKMFAWRLLVPIIANTSDYSLGIAQMASSSPAVALIDRYGQIVAAAYPDKIASDDELKQDANTEKAYYAGFAPPKCDPFGGLPGSAKALELNATGFFHVQQSKGRWILTDPAGNAYFMLGICELGTGDDYTYTQGREGIYEWLPQPGGEYDTAFNHEQAGNVFSFYIANRIRKYGVPYDKGEYTASAISRVKRWGFNAGGPFCEITPAYQSASFPYVASLPLSPWQGIAYLPGMTGVWDPFDDANRARVDANFGQSLPARASDPLLIGYYLSNEPLFEDLPRVLPQLSGKYACKRKLIRFLSDKYKTVDAFNQAWNMSSASFDALADSGLPATTDAAHADLSAFCGLFFDEYYRLVHDAFRKYDPNHMLIGNRLQTGTINNEALVRSAAKYMDILSLNYYTCSFDRQFLERIYGWSGRPMMFTEYFFDSPQTSGLPGGLLDVKTQTDRGLAYRDYVEHAASIPFVVGTSWFTLVDQASSGRWFEKYTGEKANTGLLAVSDRPYKDMVAEAAKTNSDIYSVLLGRRKPFEFDEPRFKQQPAHHASIAITRAQGAVAMDGSAKGFPGVPATPIPSSRIVLGQDAAGLSASFKLCWDDNNLYVLVDVTASTPMHNDNPPDMLWNGDAVELFIGAAKPDQDGPLLASDHQVLLGAGKASRWFVTNSRTQDGIVLVVQPGVSGHGYVIEAKLPFALLGFTPTPGQTIRFDMAIDDSADSAARVRQIVWNGTARNSGDRTNWAAARFVK
ncbi:MAG: sugar-binding protein [Capsulimonadaceae bacterium]|nr:sugar-binding protein [Capsulimonadaceae bacterium]